MSSKLKLANPIISDSFDFKVTKTKFYFPKGNPTWTKSSTMNSPISIIPKEALA